MANPRHRRSIRLPSYDYTSPGGYFVTICTHERAVLFLDPRFATIAEAEWNASAAIRQEIELDAFVVMPNHVHGIVRIVAGVGAQGLAPLPTGSQPRVAPRSIASFVRGYKSSVTRGINALRETPRQPIWQRNYYEHIIRNEASLNRIRQYIADNPARWAFDRENPEGRPDQTEAVFWRGLS